MSSPFTVPNYGYSDRAMASSPVLDSRRTAVSQGSEDVSVRPMRREWPVNIKVLRSILKKMMMQSRYSIHSTTKIKPIAWLDGRKSLTYVRQTSTRAHRLVLLS